MGNIFKQIADSEFWKQLQNRPYGRERFKDVMTHLLYNLDSEMKTFNHTLKVYADSYWKQDYIGKIQAFIKIE
jgi:hypothetical protein